jgi:hypothetical protein
MLFALGLTAGLVVMSTGLAMQLIATGRGEGLI